MKDTFKEQAKLELYELVYSATRAIKSGYFTAIVNNKIVEYTNLVELDILGKSRNDGKGSIWHDSKIVGISVGLPENIQKHGGSNLEMATYRLPRIMQHVENPGEPPVAKL